MKRVIVVSVVCAVLMLSGVSTVAAQSGTNKTLVGPKLGLLVGTMVADDEGFNDQAGHLLSYSLGVVGVFEFAPYLSVEPGLMLSQKGVKSEFIDTNFGDVTQTITMWYLELPLLARIAFPVEPGVEPKLLVGPYVAYYLDGEITESSGAASLTTDFDEDSVESLDAGIVVGGGVDVRVENIWWTLELMFQRGFVGIEADDTDGDEPMHQGILFLVGALFG